MSNELIRSRVQARWTRWIGVLASVVFNPDRSAFLSTRPVAATVGTQNVEVEIIRREASRSGPGEIRFLAEGGVIRLSSLGGNRVLSVSRLTGRVLEDEPLR